MSEKNDVLWHGRPWVTPQIAGATIIMVAIAIAAIWLEYTLGDALKTVIGIPFLYWTVIVLAIIWFLWIARYLIERASERYTLRKIGLEIEKGIISKRNIVLSTGGFSDMQVRRSLIGRILNVGDIIVRSEGEHDLRLLKVRKPVKTMEMIRDVMSRPIVRFTDEPNPNVKK